MKRITALVPNDAAPDLSGLLAIATDFRIEFIDDTQATTKRNVATRHVASGRSTLSTLMEHFTPQGVFTQDNARRWVKEHGYNPTSCSSAIHAAKKRGLIRVLGKGRYQFITALPAGELK